EHRSHSAKRHRRLRNAAGGSGYKFRECAPPRDLAIGSRFVREHDGDEYGAGSSQVARHRGAYMPVDWAARAATTVCPSRRACALEMTIATGSELPQTVARELDERGFVVLPG